MRKNILTPKKVIQLGLDKVEVITTDMLKGYTRIGYRAFFRCYCLKFIDIPNSITSIGDEAFRDCISLTSVTIPNSVTSIGEWTFAYCKNLASINIPNSVTGIGGHAFRGCISLTSVTIPNSVTSIGEWAFVSCKNLTSINIPNSVTSIGSLAFYNCYSLTSINIPNSVNYIGTDTFYGCDNLKSITINGEVYDENIVSNGKCKAYKIFHDDMIYRGFAYKEGKTYEFDGELKLGKLGFHACLRLGDVFNYLGGEIGTYICVYEVELEGVSDERGKDSEVVAKKITIGKRIL